MPHAMQAHAVSAHTVSSSPPPPPPPPPPPATDTALSLRAYQTRILQTALGANTLIILPTGTGKTLIAAETIRCLTPPALFLVPTVLLVKQQTHALCTHMPALNIAQLHGGKSLSSDWHIVVSTPMAFRSAQAVHPDLKWHCFRTVVFDEVHHMLKKHPYRTLALDLKRCGAQPRVLGLTASYTYAFDVEEAAVKLQTICDELSIHAIETAKPQELKLGGYHASCAQPLVPHQSIEAACVPTGVLPNHLRQPHLMLDMFLDRCEDGSATVLASMVLAVARTMEHILHGEDRFEAQLQHVRNVRKWSSNAYRRATKCKSSYLRRMYEQLCHWYEALRILIISWEEDDFACVWYLKMMQCHHVYTYQSIWGQWSQVCDVIAHFWKHAPRAFPRLDVLKQVLLQQQRHHMECGNMFRGIVFVQQRICTHILQHFIQTDAHLSKLFQVGCIYAHSSAASPTLHVSKTAAALTLDRFAKGSTNLLIATSVAEEGMDIPAANCVIRFDVVQTTVSFVQGRGRARQENSCFVVLKQRRDRSSAMFVEVERQQMKLLRDRMS